LTNYKLHNELISGGCYKEKRENTYMYSKNTLDQHEWMLS